MLTEERTAKDNQVKNCR